MTLGIILLCVIYTLSVMTLGFLVGVTLTIAYVSQEMKRAERELEKHLESMLSPPLLGDEWKDPEKMNDKDEGWLRRILGDNKEKK